MRRVVLIRELRAAWPYFAVIWLNAIFYYRVLHRVGFRTNENILVLMQFASLSLCLLAIIPVRKGLISAGNAILLTLLPYMPFVLFSFIRVLRQDQKHKYISGRLSPTLPGLSHCPIFGSSTGLTTLASSKKSHRTVVSLSYLATLLDAALARIYI